MKIIRQLKIIGCLTTCLFSSIAQGIQVDTSGGYYNLKASTSSGEVSLQDIGLFKANVHFGLKENISFRPGYSLYVLKGKEIDYGYGFDFSFLYYPLTTISSFQINNSSVRWVHREVFRPYVGIAFHQRQYQTIQSNYAGLGLLSGLYYRPEIIQSEEIYLVSELSIIWLEGPLDSSLNETQLTFGVGTTL